MGVLTNDMTRLCGEIGAMRRMRRTFMDGLERETTGRRTAVFQMQAGFAKAHAAMARQAKASRMVFLSNLRHWVGGRQRELRADLAGARQAWLGLSARLGPKVDPRSRRQDEVSSAPPPKAGARKETFQPPRERK